ncbi:ABC transporter substrate-binding protein [Aquisalimonas lutea]|uniref:ABC transporter substrate-binding protein n=1 Tax=Aquisalimonas lutea TaxID=1327750 RepID=UPI0025B34F21|nr:ABC transporter substrate-binding protein [Aquisalimonas lutea]MDN3519798.1 ABC transporter substrate-binding protein [Aquisalimonas lutea]
MTAGVANTSAAQDDELIPVSIGLPISNYWPGYVAREQGFFEEAGFKPEFHMFTSGAPLIAAMQSGSIDVAWTGLATLFMVHQDIPLTYLYTPLNSSSQQGFIVNPDTGIESYRDIAQASAIGAPTATCAHIATSLAADAAGVSMDEVNRRNVSPENLQPALEDGDIDAAFIWGPWSLQLQEAGYPVVSWDRDYNGEVCATNVAARPSFLEEHPEAGCRLVKAQALTLEATEANPELAVTALQRVLGLSEKLARETYETLEIPSLESQIQDGTAWSLTEAPGGLVDKLHTASKALHSAEVFPEPVSREKLDDAVTPEYVEQFLNGEC